MKIEIDIEDVVDEWVKESYNKSYGYRGTACTCERVMYKMLGAVIDYENRASILLNILERFEDDCPGELNRIREYRAQRKQDDADMPGGFN